MWETLVPILATLGGAYYASTANTAAANTAAAATLQGANIQAGAITDATNRSIALEQQGLQQSQDQYRAIEAETQPAATYLRGVMAGPNSLTPQQQQQLDALDRQTRNQISTSSIAGSGRTAAALLQQGDQTFRNNAIAANTARADTAANTVYGRGSQASLSSAAAPLNAAGVMSGTAFQGGSGAGAAVGKGVTDAAGIQANAGIANASLTGSAIGDIGNLIASESRLSRYGTMNQNNNDKLIAALNGTKNSSYTPSGGNFNNPVPYPSTPFGASP